MKKIWMIAVVLGVLVLALGATGMAYAQAETPSDPVWSLGFMGGRFGHGPGMWGAFDGDDSLQEATVAGLAERLGLTPEELEARLAAVQTPWQQITQGLGLSDEAFQDQLGQSHADALAQAVAEGQITQEQADWMLERQSAALDAWNGAGPWEQGFGPGRWGAAPWAAPTAPAQ